MMGELAYGMHTVRIWLIAAKSQLDLNVKMGFPNEGSGIHSNKNMLAY